MFSASMLCQRLIVLLHVLVQPQKYRNYILCCAASARQKCHNPRTHENSLAHCERRIKASPSRMPLVFFTRLFTISQSEKDEVDDPLLCL